MKIAMSMAPDSSPAIAEAARRHFARVRGQLAADGIELAIVFLDEVERGAEGREPASSAAVITNRALARVRAERPDAVLLTGANHLVDAPLIAAAAAALPEAGGCAALRSQQWLRALTLQCVEWESVDGAPAPAMRLVSAAVLDRAEWQPCCWSDPGSTIVAFDRGMSAFAPDVAAAMTLVDSDDRGLAVGLFTGSSSDWWALAAGRPRVDGVRALRRALPAPEYELLLARLGVDSRAFWSTCSDPLLSAAVIALVEDRFQLDDLVAALRSVAGITDEAVIVLDDRSSEEALDALRSIGARVVRRAWSNDFAAARNYADSLCSTRWSLVIDADELVLDSGDLRDRVERADAAGANAVGVVVDVVAEGGRRGRRLIQPRVYRRAACQWRYPVHNELVGLEGQRLEVSTARMESSYVGSVTAKAVRALDVLLAMAAAEPGAPRWPLLIAQTMFNLGRAGDAERWAARAIELAPNRPECAPAWIDLTYARLAAQGENAPLPTVLEALQHHPRHPDLWHTLAAVALAYWQQASMSPPPEAIIESRTLRHVRGLPQAASILGIPFVSADTQRIGRDDEGGGR